MNGIVAWWVRNPVAANLLMLMCIISGFLAFNSMGKNFFPSITAPVAQIRVQWPGASPKEVEDQILKPVEEAISDIEGIVEVSATAFENYAFILVELNPNASILEKIAEIKVKVDGLSNLPRDSYPPTVEEFRFSDRAIRIAIWGDVDEKTLFNTAHRLRDDLTTIRDAELVNIFGARDEEFSINIDEATLDRYGLTFDQIAAAIRASSINLTSGAVKTDSGDISVRARSLAETKQAFEDITIFQSSDGAILKLSDIATVEDGFEDNELIATFNGHPTVLLDVIAPEKYDIVELTDRVKNWIEEQNELIDERLQLSVWQDASTIYKGRMSLIFSNATLGLALVLVVLMLFLRPSVAFWVAVGIFTAYCGGLIFLPMFGVTLNVLSTFGFLLVIGIVVDDAIVVGESIHERVEEGLPPIDAAIFGAQLVLKPVVFAVLTTMIAFAPWMFIDQVTAQIFKHITLVIVFALAFSLIESLLILPAHLAHLKPMNKNNPITKVQQLFANSIIWLAANVYRPAIKFAISWRYPTVMLFFSFFMFAIGMIANGHVGQSFNPDIENDEISLNIEMASGTSFETAYSVMKYVQEKQRIILDRLAEENGGDASSIVSDWYTRARKESVLAIMQLTPPEERNRSGKEIGDMLLKEIGEISAAERIKLTTAIDDGSGQSDLSIRLNSANGEDLLLASMELQQYLKHEYEGISTVSDSSERARDEIHLELKPGAQQLGLTLRDVSRQVRQAFFGEEVQRFPRNGRDISVYLRYPRAERESVEKIENFRVRTADGRRIPLLAVADISYRPALSKIERVDRQQTIRVDADLIEGTNAKEIFDDLNENFFPQLSSKYPTVERETGGDLQDQQEFFEQILPLAVIAFFIMYALLAIPFKSYFQPILILFALPFGFMGSVFGHWMFGFNLSMFSYFGVFAACGVVVNDNLVLVDYIGKLRERGQGAFDAIVNAGTARFRPIILTSVTTVIGLMPIMYERSIQAQFLQPTVIAVSAGVAFATFVTLLFVPSLYAVGVDIARLARWTWTGERQGAIGAHSTGDKTTNVQYEA